MIRRRLGPIIARCYPQRWASLEVFDQRIALRVEADDEGQTWLSVTTQLGLDRWVTFTVWIDFRRLTR